MTFLTSIAVVIVATVLGAWINDNTKIGGEYLSDDELDSKKAAH